MFQTRGLTIGVRVLIGLLVVLAIVVVAWLVMRPACRDRRPNILLITLDTTRADRIGCYGYAAGLTPALDALAARGVLFEQAHVSVPLTLPSHATILTGLHPAEHGLRINGSHRLDAGIPTLASLLGGQGYATAAFIAAFALDSQFALDRGFEAYDDDMSQAYQADHGNPFAVYRPGNVVTDAALAWLGQRGQRGEQPFFCWVHLYDPHLPYYAHPELAGTRFDGQASYDAEVAFMDLQVGRLTAFLREQGLDQRTMVIAIGDHGEALGEHGETGHGYMLYDTTQWVPLIFSAPGRCREGLRVPAYVASVDVFPTILEMVGIPMPGARMGRSLVPALSGQTIDSLPCYGETDLGWRLYGWSPLRALTTPDFKYIRTAKPELYDRRTDPAELDNLAERLPEKLAELSAELARIESTLTPCQAQEVKLTTDEQRRLQALGYVASPARDVDTSKLELARLHDIKDMFPLTVQVMEMLSLREKGETDRVLEMCQAMAQKSPESSRLRMYLGDALLKAGQAAEAAAEFREALRLDPENEPALNNLFNTLLELGQTEEAASLLTDAAKLGAASPEAHARLSEAMLRRGQTEQALEQARQAVRLDDNNALAHDALGRALAAQGHLDQAIEQFAKVVQLRPDATAHVNLGLALVRQRQLDSAIQEFRLALELDAKNDEALYNLGNVFMEKGELDEAIRCFREAIALRPRDAAAHTNLGNVLLAKGLVDEAIAECIKAVRLDRNMLPAHYNLGVAYLYLGQLDLAIRHLREVLRIDPTQAGARKMLQEALARRGLTSQPASSQAS